MGDRTAQLAAFCVVANVAEETASGEGGLDVRAGARHFAPGAKVWVLPPQWGDGGYQVIVAGHHRGTRGRRGLARMVMPRRNLTGFRVQGAYSPAVIWALTRPLTELGLDHAPRLWATRQEAENIAAAWRDLPLAAHADDGSFTTVVADPPPMQITREGRTYYLAHCRNVVPLLYALSMLTSSSLLTSLLTGPRGQVGAGHYRDARFQDARADEAPAGDNHRQNAPAGRVNSDTEVAQYDC